MIKEKAFYNCSRLKTITIPATVEFIYQNAFNGCNALESVKVLAETPPFAYDNTFSNYEIELCVPEKSVEAYQKTNPWSKFKTFKNLTDIANVKALPVVVQANNGTITVTGANDGTMVEVYGISGTKLGEAKTALNKAAIHTDAQTGCIVIVKVGNKSIKIVL